jgi:hypothetical protein
MKELFDGKVGDKVVFLESFTVLGIIESTVGNRISIQWDNGHLQDVYDEDWELQLVWKQVVVYESEQELLQLKIKYG